MTVGSVVRHFLLLMVEDGAVIQDRLGHAVSQNLGVINVDDRILGSHDPEWLKGAMYVLILLFLNISMVANIAKLNIMT